LKLYENNEKKTVRKCRYTRKIDENNEIKEKDIERVWESLILLIHCSINQRRGFSGCRSSLLISGDSTLHIFIFIFGVSL
jgi:hypothetical protein